MLCLANSWSPLTPNSLLFMLPGGDKVTSMKPHKLAVSPFKPGEFTCLLRSFGVYSAVLLLDHVQCRAPQFRRCIFGSAVPGPAWVHSICCAVGASLQCSRCVWLWVSLHTLGWGVALGKPAWPSTHSTVALCRPQRCWLSSSCGDSLWPTGCLTSRMRTLAVLHSKRSTTAHALLHLCLHHIHVVHVQPCCLNTACLTHAHKSCIWSGQVVLYSTLVLLLAAGRQLGVPSWRGQLACCSVGDTVKTLDAMTAASLRVGARQPARVCGGGLSMRSMIETSWRQQLECMCGCAL
jgi:hypothetical protein